MLITMVRMPGTKGLRENGAQNIIGLLRYRSHTEGLRLCNEIGIGTKCSAHFNEIGCVEVTATFELERK